jgi:hypothetical protein
VIVPSPILSPPLPPLLTTSPIICSLLLIFIPRPFYFTPLILSVLHILFQPKSTKLII